MASYVDEPEPLTPWNFTWIVKRELAIMGYLKSKGNINFIVNNGIRTLVSLSPEKQPPFEHFPNDFTWTPLDVLEFEPPNLGQIISFIDICKVALASGDGIGVHCRMGKGRSGVMAACYMLYFYDLNPDKAITHVRLASPGSIETYKQEKAVWAYNDYLRSLRQPTPPPRPGPLDHLNPDKFIPDTNFNPRNIRKDNSMIDKYVAHIHGCAKPVVLPHRVEIRRTLARKHNDPEYGY